MAGTTEEVLSAIGADILEFGAELVEIFDDM